MPRTQSSGAARRRALRHGPRCSESVGLEPAQSDTMTITSRRAARNPAAGPVPVTAKQVPARASLAAW